MHFTFTQKIISMLALLSIYTYANPMPTGTAKENDLVGSWHEVREDGIVQPIEWCSGYDQSGCQSYCNAEGFRYGKCNPGYVNPE